MKSDLKAVAYQGAAYALQLGFMVLVARQFGPELQGDYAVVRTTVFLAESFMWFGLISGTVYVVGSDFQRLHDPLVAFAISYLYLLAVASVLTGIATQDFLDSLGVDWFRVVVWTLSLGLFQLFQKIFLGQRRFALYNALNVVNASLLFVYFLLGISSIEQNLESLISVHILANAICLAIALVYHDGFLRKIRLFTALNLQSLERLLAVGFKGYGSALLFMLLYRVDFYIVGYFLDKPVLGRYTVAVLIVEAIQKPSAWLGTILSPLVASGEDRSGLITTRFVIMSVCSVVFLGLVLGLMEVFSPDFTGRWLGPGYEGTSLIALALLPRGLAYGVMVVLGGNLAGRGYTYFHPLAGLLALVVLAAINLLLIDRVGVWGAVIASTLAMCVAAFVMYRGTQVARNSEFHRAPSRETLLDT